METVYSLHAQSAAFAELISPADAQQDALNQAKLFRSNEALSARSLLSPTSSASSRGNPAPRPRPQRLQQASTRSAQSPRRLDGQSRQIRSSRFHYAASGISAVPGYHGSRQSFRLCQRD